METSGPHSDGRSGHSLHLSPISQLPTELFVKILNLELHSSAPLADILEETLYFYMQRLYTMRLVAKRWQQIIDGTPTFWTFVLSTLPPDVNRMTIMRSNNGPLSIIYPSQVVGNPSKRVLPKDFLATVAHTRSRWFTYSGPLVPEYLGTTAPLLQKIKLWRGFRQESNTKPLELLGGCASGLRHVELSEVLILWRVEMFSQLRSLTLDNISGDGFSTSHILDYLRASPYLEDLKLKSLYTADESTPPSPIITFPQLRSIVLSRCHDRVTEPILQHIRAPFCINFSLKIHQILSDEDTDRLINETLVPFQGTLRAIHDRNGLSEIVLNNSGLKWQSGARNDNDHRLRVYFGCDTLFLGIRWVEGVLGSNPCLRINFSCMINDRAVMEIIGLMRCVTSVVIGEYQRQGGTRLVLQFLAKPLSTDPPSSSLPCLRELILIPVDWIVQDLLDSLQSRFDSLLWEAVERPPLVVKVARGAFSWLGSPRPILDYAALTQIRETKGVGRVELIGSKERDGMLAVVWNEEASRAVWC